MKRFIFQMKLIALIISYIFALSHLGPTGIDGKSMLVSKHAESAVLKLVKPGTGNLSGNTSYAMAA
jgi:hypothetical protein